jgi:chorismate mutase
MMNGRIITFQFMLHDEPGMLSTILGLFAQNKANIQTINSIIPTNGCALVTISTETRNLTVSLELLLQELGQTPGVIKAEVLAG